MRDCYCCQAEVISYSFNDKVLFRVIKDKVGEYDFKVEVNSEKVKAYHIYKYA